MWFNESMSNTNENTVKCIYCYGVSSPEKPIVPSTLKSQSMQYGVCSSCSSDLEKAFAEAINEEQEKHLNDDEVIVKRLASIIKPKDIVEFLNKSIISQDLAKRELACAMYEHMKRKVIYDVTGVCEIRKANVFMMGKSGVSKTEMIRQLVKLMDIPMVTIDCTSVTEAGYVGDSIDDKLVALVDKAGGDLNKAGFGVVFLDEVDKLRRMGGSSQTTANVGHEGVQEALLKVIEGTEITVSASAQKKASGRTTNTLDTTNILFVASGAFEGIESYLGLKGESEIGFIKEKQTDKEDETKLYRKIRSEHLIDYGFKPEFIGRFYNFVPFDDLTKLDLIEILEKSSLSRIKESILSFKLDGCALTFEKDCFEAIADIAIKEKTGARTLNKVVDTVLRDARYSANNGEISELKVDAKYVKDNYQ